LVVFLVVFLVIFLAMADLRVRRSAW